SPATRVGNEGNGVRRRVSRGGDRRRRRRTWVAGRYEVAQTFVGLRNLFSSLAANTLEIGAAGVGPANAAVVVIGRARSPPRPTACAPGRPCARCLRARHRRSSALATRTSGGADGARRPGWFCPCPRRSPCVSPVTFHGRRGCSLPRHRRYVPARGRS